MIKKLFIKSILLSFCLYTTVAYANSDTIKLGILHPNWKGVGGIEVNKEGLVKRIGSSDKGKLKIIDKRTIQIKWDTYGVETFKKFGKWFVKYDKSSVDALKQEYRQLDYHFQKPYVKLNPFNQNPLAAYVHFETPDDKSVQVTVKGKDGAADLIFPPIRPKKTMNCVCRDFIPGIKII